MEYDYREKKIVAVVDSKLEVGVALNVVGHLAVSIGHNASDHMGRPVLTDGSGVDHLGISRYPFIITKSNAGKIRKVLYSEIEEDIAIVQERTTNAEW